MADLRQLAANMRRYARELPQRANALAKEVSITILNDLVNITPVDTSAAISNWQVNAGSMPTGTIQPYFPGFRGSTVSQSVSATLEAGLSEIAFKQPGQPLHITNNLDYIIDLNDGSSKQAPANFVERAVLLGDVAASKGLGRGY